MCWFIFYKYVDCNDTYSIFIYVWFCPAVFCAPGSYNCPLPLRVSAKFYIFYYFTSKQMPERLILLYLITLACRDCGFESRWEAWKSVVSVVCCQVEVSASGCSLFQRSPTECDVSERGRKGSILKRPWSTSGCCPIFFLGGGGYLLKSRN
jgi:hypothetical protein